MVEAAGQEIVLKIFKKLRGVWLVLDLVGGVQSFSTTAVYMHPWMVF